MIVKNALNSGELLMLERRVKTRAESSEDVC